MNITITPAELALTGQLLRTRHAAHLHAGETFTVSTWHKGVSVHVKCLMRNEDSSFYYPIEARVNMESSKLKTYREAYELLADFIDYYLGEFFKEERELYIPIEFAEVTFGDHPIEAKGQIFNRKLELLADKLLSGELSPDEVDAGRRRRKKRS